MTIAFPGYVADVVALTGRIKAEWGNAIRDRSNQVFDTMAHLVAGIASPQVGQVAVITTGTGAGIYEYVGATDTWTQPWNLPWGRVAEGLSTTNQTISGATNITGETATWTAVANRRYKVTVTAPYWQKATANGFGYARLVDGSNVEDTHLREWANINEYRSQALSWEITGLSAGSVTRRLRMEASAGTIIVAGASSPQYIIVEDIGPNGAPV